MMFEILCIAFIGIFAGIITGLIPGVHINLVSILLVSLSVMLYPLLSPIAIGVFIISMGVTHTFLDVIPSVYLGAPDADQALSALPGHRLLLEGKGFEAVKLATIGSLVCLILTVLLIPLLVLILSFLYSSVANYIGYILLSVVLFMILKEGNLRNILLSTFIFMLSGILGIIVLSIYNLNQPLFPMLSGLFGISTLLISLLENSVIPIQSFKESIVIKPIILIRAFLAGTISGILTGIFPGLGSAQAGILGSEISGDIGDYGFIVLIGGINTVNFIFSLATFFVLGKARNGAVVSLMDIVGSISLNELIFYLSIVLIVGGIAAYLALYLSRFFSSFIMKLNYRFLCIFIIFLILVMTIYFSGIIGFFVLFTATSIGLLPQLLSVKRSHSMGCLMLPIILFFLL